MILNGAEIRLLSSGEFQTLNGSGTWVTIESNIVDARWSNASYDGGRVYLLPNTGPNDTRVSFPPYTTTSQGSGGDWNDAVGRDLGDGTTGVILESARYCISLLHYYWH